MDQIGKLSLQIGRICRFCLSQSGVMSPIFEQDDLNPIPLSSKIMTFVSIQLHAHDGLPSLICHRCLYQVEKSYEFKTQCETTDAMLHKYYSSLEAISCNEYAQKENQDCSTGARDMLPFLQMQKNLGLGLNGLYFNDSPFKRKRGRPRKEENLIFYSSPSHQVIDPGNGISVPENEIKIVDGIESVVTVVDPGSEMLSNSEDENKNDTHDINENSGERENESKPSNPAEGTLDSLAAAKAKAKKYMGIVFGVDENGMRIRRHLCKGCGKTFGHCSDLRKHVLVHTGERPFHCQICTKNFSRSTNLNKHMKVHTGQKPFLCTNCPKSFTTRGDLQRHLIIHSGVKPFSCHLCHHCFSRKDKLTRHLKLHEGTGSSKKINFKCTLCSEVFHSRVDLNQHLDTIHNGCTIKNEEEEDINQNFGNVSNQTQKKKEILVSNEIKVEGELNSDEKESEDVESMVISLDPFHMDSAPNDVCNSWDQNGKEQLQDQTERPTFSESEKNIQFSIGSGITVTAIPKTSKPSLFNKAPLTKVPDLIKNIFQCQICHRKQSDAFHLQTHMQTHFVEKPHKCTMCEKSFSRRRELLRHENVHTGVKPFKCPTCDKAFSRKDKLVRHEKIHNGIKKYSCISCPASFLRKEELNGHYQNYHGNEKLQNCGFCYESFSTKQDLQHHENVYHSNSNHICSICSSVFENYETLQEHMKIHQNEDLDAEISDEESKDDVVQYDKSLAHSNPNSSQMKLLESDFSERESDEEDDVNYSINQLNEQSTTSPSNQVSMIE